LAKGRDDALDAADAELVEMREGDVSVDVVLRLSDRLAAAGGRATARSDRSASAGDRLTSSSDREAARADLMAEGVDELTGALRRQVGMAAVGRELERTRRSGASLTVAFIDVDGLKAVNDAHGHRAGDALLRGLADCITRTLRPYDLVLRYGGDEFFCALNDQDAVSAAKRFATISATFVEQHGGTFSVGFAEARATDTPDQLVARADEALLALPGRRARRSGPRDH
jgi:diguanylate cyclase (GGDEF)-like protein